MNLSIKQVACIFMCWLGMVMPALAQSGEDLIDPDAFGYYERALSFSRDELVGSSRVLGYGGAQTALGGDLSTLAMNPAGIAVFRKSDAGLSLGLQFGNSSSKYFSPTEETTTRDRKDNLNITNMGVVFAEASDDPKKGPWKTQAFGITLTRQSNFHDRVSYQGDNTDNSFRGFLAESMNGIYWADLNLQRTTNENVVDDLLGAAYWTYLGNAIAEDDDQSNSNNYRYFTINPDVGSTQKEVITTTGRKQQWNFAYGANYEDKILIGADIGIASMKHEIRRRYTETPFGNDTTDLESLVFEEAELTDGNGININGGIIVKPIDLLRVGVSFHSPTFFSLTEEYQSSLQANYNDLSLFGQPGAREFEYSTAPSVFEYSLVTPWRVSLGTAIFMGKNGFLTADVDYVGYDRMQLNSDIDPLSADNATIISAYKSTANYRLGGEFRSGDFRARAGFAYYGDPQRKELENISLSQTYITLGGGIKTKDYYLDLVLLRTSDQRGTRRYAVSSGNEPIIRSKSNNVQVVVTGGVTF